MAEKTKLEGWVEKTEKEVGYFKCPFCGVLKWTVSISDGIMLNVLNAIISTLSRKWNKLYY